jgi:hypothetical protein
MARKPNYQFDRMERERLKAAKKAERAALKEEARKKKTEESESGDAPSDVPNDGE